MVLHGVHVFQIFNAEVCHDYYMGLIMHAWEIHTLIFIPIYSFRYQDKLRYHVATYQESSATMCVAI